MFSSAMLIVLIEFVWQSNYSGRAAKKPRSRYANRLLQGGSVILAETDRLMTGRTLIVGALWPEWRASGPGCLKVEGRVGPPAWRVGGA